MTSIQRVYYIPQLDLSMIVSRTHSNFFGLREKLEICDKKKNDDRQQRKRKHKKKLYSFNIIDSKRIARSVSCESSDKKEVKKEKR